MALSDPEGILASPLNIIDRREEQQDIAAIAAIIEQHRVGHIIVGLPRSMNGNLGPQAEKVQEFAEKLRGVTAAALEYRDERLTTVAAKRLLHSARTGKARKRVQDDAAAAALILQGYLDEVYEIGDYK